MLKDIKNGTMKHDASPIKADQSIILASSSEPRRAVLESAGISFQVVVPHVDESSLRESLSSEPLHIQAQRLAQAKAESIATSYPSNWVIGADQICALHDRIFEKPGTQEHAIAQLKELRGHTHQLYSALCLMRGGQRLWWNTTVSHLTMDLLSDDDILSYVALEQPLNACGGYHFESRGRHLFNDVEGASDAIQGLPLIPLLTALRTHQAMSLSDILVNAEQHKEALSS